MLKWITSNVDKPPTMQRWNAKGDKSGYLLDSGMYSKPFTVAVVGGGMCGLVLSIALARAGIKVDLFEAAPKFGEFGAGVGIGINAIKALQKLGVYDSITSYSKQQPNNRPMSFAVGQGVSTIQPFFEYAVKPEDAMLPIHRSVFLESLIPLLPPDIVHFNKRCIGVTRASVNVSSEKYTVHFADGTQHDANVIIGADGVRSVIRNAVVWGIPSAEEKPDLNIVDKHGYANLAFTGLKASRALIPIKQLLKDGVKADLMKWTCVMGRDKHVIYFPVSSNKLLNVVVYTTDTSTPPCAPPLTSPWVTSTPTEGLLASFDDKWAEDVRKIISHIKEPSTWSVHATDPVLDWYINGKVVVIGDAAHATTPHLGAGVGQGFEDVLLLWRLLTHPHTGDLNLQDVLIAYDDIRRPRANNTVKWSAAAGNIFESYSPTPTTVTPYTSDVEKLKDRLQGIWDPIWSHDVDKDYDRAAEFLIRERKVWAHR